MITLIAKKMTFEYDYESDADAEETESDAIFEMDEDFMDAEKLDSAYYIGLPGYLANQNQLLLMNSISPTAFFKHDHAAVLKYLVEYSTSRINKPKVHILQVHVDEHQAYNVTIKTFWLKLVQRAWKRVFKERQQIISQSKNPRLIQGRSLGNVSRPKLPSIQGLLVKSQ
jgi:hypothetical protein